MAGQEHKQRHSGGGDGGRAFTGLRYSLWFFWNRQF